MKRTVILVLAVALATAAYARSPIFKITDPYGDDYGDGTMKYPLRSDMEAGDLDLVSFAAYRVEGGTDFEATFAKQIKKPGPRAVDLGGGNLDELARFGFYTFNLDVYVDTDGVPGSGSTNALPGRNAAIAEANAWERAVVLTPRPYEARASLRRMLLREVRRDKKEQGERLGQDRIDALRGEIADDVEKRVFFPTRIVVRGNKVRFFVPDEFFGGPAQAGWSYVIGVTGADLDVRFDVKTEGEVQLRGDNMFVIPLAQSPSDNRFGGGREGEGDLQPNFVDIVVPNGTSQKDVLRGYDLQTDRLVQLPGVKPGG